MIFGYASGSTLYPCDKLSWSVVVSNLRGFEVSELFDNMRMFRRASSVRRGIQAGRGDDETGVGRETGSSRKTRRSLLLGRNGREEVGGSMGSRGRQWEEEMGESTGSRGRMMGGRRRRGMRRELQTPRSGQRLGGKSIDRQVNLQNHHQKDKISYSCSAGSWTSSSSPLSSTSSSSSYYSGSASSEAGEKSNPGEGGGGRGREASQV